MSDRYSVRNCDYDFDVVGFSIYDEDQAVKVQVVDTKSRRFDETPLVFADLKHAEDFAAALNLGCKAREAESADWSIWAYDSLNGEEREGLQYRMCGYLNAWKYLGQDDWTLDGEQVVSLKGNFRRWWYEAMDEAANTRRQGLS